MAKHRVRGDGCGFLLLTCLFMSCGLLFNAMVAFSIYGAFKPHLPQLLQEQKATALLLFAAPILMLVAEWFLLDRIVDRLTPDSNGKG